MRAQIDRFTCDNCRTVVDFQRDVYGGNPVQGWLRVEPLGRVSYIGTPKGPWDFCGEKCCIEFFSKRKD